MNLESSLKTYLSKSANHEESDIRYPIPQLQY